MQPGPGGKIIVAAIFFLLISFMEANAQLTSSSANRVDTVTYPVSPGKDPLFVFYQTNGVSRPGRLTASPGSPGSFTFEWRRYNPDLPGFDAVFQTDADVASSTVADLDEGGYRVRITDGAATDIALIGWVMLDDFHVEVEKTADGKVRPYKRTCDFLVMSGFVEPDTFIYYDPVSRDTLVMPVGFRFQWTSDNNDLRIPNDTTVLDPNITYQPPYEDTWYILTATDDLGMGEVDSVFYESIQTKAEFSVEYYDKVTDSLDAELTGSWSQDKGSTDAPLTVHFNNESLNGAVFEWVLLDTLGGVKQTETTYDLDESVEFTYFEADEFYYPYLVSTSEEGCIDTFRLEEPIYVQPSQLVIPNYFSPNGDAINDMWLFKHQSINTCRLTIVDRTGKVVYRRRIENIYDWEGWDGNLHDSDRRAPEGQYYYVVEAMGHDGLEYKDLNIFEQWRSNRGRNNQGGQQPGGQDPENGGNNLYTGWLYLYR